MLKGCVFKRQIFESHVFAYFVDTFLGGKCGVGDFGNKMEITSNSSNIVIQNGLVVIKGRFLEEDSSTTLDAGTENAYCKLVIEVDLDKQNTDEAFYQGIYKIIKSTSDYPTLTQTDIVKNNSGIYQYELARFRTSSNGITDLQDMRTYVDFQSIYEKIQTDYKQVLDQLKQELAEVEGGSAYFLKNNIVVITQKASSNGVVLIDYPEGFNKNNTVVLSVCVLIDGKPIYHIQTTGEGVKTETDSILLELNTIHLVDDNIQIQRARRNYNYKIVLMKCE